ncbi:MAG: MerR family transcriptional regulator [Spirochaetaceae bacterium]|jgi:DNA-binding transcriptional MerR regulator|nr:MerR family transcriptional regulator [Spirochaetaceae bacterium]
MLSIGEFSMASRLTVKALRDYHELGLLIPRSIHEVSGYRFYDQENLRRARQIMELKELGFTLSELQEIIDSGPGELEKHLDKKDQQLSSKVQELQSKKEKLRQWRLRMKEETPGIFEEIHLMQIPELGYLSYEIFGRYEDIGQGFFKLDQRAGAYITGPNFALHHQLEYREENAHMEACCLAQGAPMIRDLKWKTLGASQGVSLIHRGPYQDLGISYEHLFSFCRDKGYTIGLPIREIYLKGPEVDHWGDPKNHVTEIQLRISAE